MFGNPSLVTRIAIGKGIGLAFGLLFLLLYPIYMPEVGWLPRIGILLWYPTLGAVVGVYGVFTSHPVLKLPLPWWFRAPLIGAWMNFVLTLFAYDHFKDFMVAAFGADAMLQSPFWFAAEGAVIGLIIGFFATRYGGEGAETVGK